MTRNNVIYLKDEKPKTLLKELTDSLADSVIRSYFKKHFLLHGLDIFPNTMRVGDYTIVVIRTRKNGKPIEAIGFTRKSKKDEDNPELALSIAMGRAKKALELRLQGKKIDKLYMG